MSLFFACSLDVEGVQCLCVMSGAKKLSLYEEVLRQVRYVNSEPQELNSRTFVLSCTELNGRFVSNKLETTVCDSLSCLARLCNHFCCAMHMHSADYAMARCPSVCHTPVLCVNGYTYPQSFFTVG